MLTGAKSCTEQQEQQCNQGLSYYADYKARPVAVNTANFVMTLTCTSFTDSSLLLTQQNRGYCLDHTTTKCMQWPRQVKHTCTPVSQAGGALVWQLIRSSGQQCTAEAAGHHGGHHRRLIAPLLLQELQVQLGGHCHFVPGVLGGLPILVHSVGQGGLCACCPCCELEVGQLAVLCGAAAVHCAVPAQPSKG